MVCFTNKGFRGFDIYMLQGIKEKDHPHHE